VSGSITGQSTTKSVMGDKPMLNEFISVAEGFQTSVNIAYDLYIVETSFVLPLDNVNITLLSLTFFMLKYISLTLYIILYSQSTTYIHIKKIFI
jgi:hypothetical protein